MSMPDFSGDVVIEDRGGIVENRHALHAAVVDASGRLLYAVGDPGRVTLIRSAAKPAQAVAILETATVEFEDEEVALLCASHNSEARHLAIARGMLAKTATSETDLRCGGHPSIAPALARAWVKADFTPTAIHNNCSGKHIGMLAGAKALTGVDGYHRLDHPMQRRVRRAVEAMCDLPPDDVRWGVDGCNLPAPAIPLAAMGRMYARLAAAESEASSRARVRARIFRCMATHPGLVAGDGRFCTVLMEAYRGGLVGKVGADGCYGVALRPSPATAALGTPHAVGIGVKVEDGNLDILYAAVAEILDRLQLLSPEAKQAVAPFHHPPRRNTMDVVIGHVSFPFTVRKVQAGRDTSMPARANL